MAAGSPLLLEGRPVYVSMAVDKATAQRLGENSEASHKPVKPDKRHLYLANEGKLSQDKVPKTDRLKRETAEAEKKDKVRRHQDKALMRRRVSS